VLGQDDDDPWQDEFYHALVGLNRDGTPMDEPKRRLALAACKGPGKSAALAGAMWWFKVCFPDSKVVATSITGDNLRANLWTELAVWQNHSRLLMAAYEWTEDMVYEKGRRELSYMMALEWQRSANPEQMANNLAGLHARYIMAVADESGGIPRKVFGALDAVLANVDEEAGRIAYVLQAGNCTTTDGPLYDACSKDRRFWWVKNISGDPERADRAKRVSKEWAQQQIDMHPGGRSHPWVKVNVLGEFPPGGANNLITLEACTQAQARDDIPQTAWMQAPKVMGVDIARFGDDETAIAFRQGPVAFPFKCFRNLDLMAVAGQVALSIDRWNPDAVFIDETGLGAGVVDRLVQLKYRVTGVNFGDGPIGFANVGWKLKNRREEMWWQLPEWLKKGAIPNDSQLVADLVAPTYKFTADNKLELESKKDMKKRGLPSPNRGDALALTFAEPVPHRGLASAQRLVEQQLNTQGQERKRYHPFPRRR
jgi:hypothetical protein